MGDPLALSIRGRRYVPQEENVATLVRLNLVLALEECASRQDTPTALSILSTLIREMRFLPRLIFHRATEVLSSLADADEKLDEGGRDSSDARLALFQLYRLAIASEAESSLGVSRSDLSVPSSKIELPDVDPLLIFEARLFGSGVESVHEKNEEEQDEDNDENPQRQDKTHKIRRPLLKDDEEDEEVKDKEDDNDTYSNKQTGLSVASGKRNVSLKRKRPTNLISPASSLEDRMEAISREQELRHDFIRALLAQTRGQPEHTVEALAVAQAALQGTERPRNKSDPVLYGLAGLAAWNLYVSLQSKDVISNLSTSGLPRWILSNLNLQSKTTPSSISGNDRAFHNEQQASQHLKTATKYLSRSHALSCKRMKRAAKLLKAAVLFGDREAARVARLVLHSREVGATDSAVSISLCFALRVGGPSSEAGVKKRDENVDSDVEHNESGEESETATDRPLDLVKARGGSNSGQSKRLSEWKRLAGRVLRRFITAACPGWILAKKRSELSATALSLLHFAEKEGFLQFVLKKKV
jgi:hypothetical protein